MSDGGSSYRSLEGAHPEGSDHASDSYSYADFAAEVELGALLEGHSLQPQGLEMSFFPSTMTEEGLVHLRERFNIPSYISLRCPSEGELPHSPPPGEVAFYGKMFNCGVRLPLHFFPQNFLSEAGIAPAQLSPNGWNILLSCWVLWHLFGRGATPSYRAIAYLYHLKVLPGEDHRYYLASRDAPLVESPSSVKNWKAEWFFVGGDWMLHEPGREYVFPVPSSFQVPGGHDSKVTFSVVLGSLL